MHHKETHLLFVFVFINIIDHHELQAPGHPTFLQCCPMKRKQSLCQCSGIRTCKSTTNAPTGGELGKGTLYYGTSYSPTTWPSWILLSTIYPLLSRYNFHEWGRLKNEWPSKTKGKWLILVGNLLNFSWFVLSFFGYTQMHQVDEWCNFPSVPHPNNPYEIVPPDSGLRVFKLGSWGAAGSSPQGWRPTFLVGNPYKPWFPAVTGLGGRSTLFTLSGSNIFPSTYRTYFGLFW